MQRIVMLLLGASVLALAAPSAFERYKQRIAADEPEAVPAPSAIVEAAVRKPQPSPSGSTSIAAGPDGHFRVEARLNGRPERVLVDTGATYVAISGQTARRLGLRLKPADFKHRAQTANGEMAVALATIDRIAIGRVEVRDVEAMVAEGNGLGETLLGMSFLGKLRSFEVRSDTLNLVR